MFWNGELLLAAYILYSFYAASGRGFKVWTVFACGLSNVWGLFPGYVLRWRMCFHCGKSCSQTLSLRWILNCSAGPSQTYDGKQHMSLFVVNHFIASMYYSRQNPIECWFHLLVGLCSESSSHCSVDATICGVSINDPSLLDPTVIPNSNI